MNAVGVSVMSAFATLWWILGLQQSAHGSPAGYALAPILSLALAVIAWRAQRRAPQASEAARARVGRIVGLASGAEGLLILVAANVLDHLGRGDLFAPVVAVIVGLHFLPLAHWLPVGLYHATGLLLVAHGLACCAITDLPLRALVTGTGAAALLWATSAIVTASILRAGRTKADTRLRPSAA